ncbi:Uma2 family endonuclease [Phytohabitans kaempferiae]|uniref:Uma2 family endonuclease n=1 Tax=Phytohabitans kaempferiae TaxID=1620943 RepID=A0ABV6M0W2_9ACTN
MELKLELPGALPLTAEEFAAVPVVEGVRMELEEGNLVVMASAQMMWHTMTARRIQDWFRAQGLFAEREVGVVVGPRSVPAPDVTVFYKPVSDLRRSQFPAADVRCVVEVVSPESVSRDRVSKPLKYAAAGIPEFWLVEEHPDAPADAIVKQHRLAGSAYTVARTVTLAEIEAS